MGTTAMRAVVVSVGALTIAVGIGDLWQALVARFTARPPTFDVRDS